MDSMMKRKQNGIDGVAIQSRDGDTPEGPLYVAHERARAIKRGLRPYLILIDRVLYVGPLDENLCCGLSRCMLSRCDALSSVSNTLLIESSAR